MGWKKLSREKGKGTIYANVSLLLVAIFWGGGFVAVKDAITSITPFYMVSIRFGVSGLILALLSWRKLQNLKWYDIRMSIFVGIFLFLGFSAQTAGAQFTTAGKQAFLTGTNVVIVPFLVWILYKERLGGYSIIASILCFFGIGFLTLKEGLAINPGDILTLACAVFFAFHITLLDRYAKRIDTLALTIIQMLTTAVLSSICALVFEPFPKNISTGTYSSMVYMVLFSTMLGFLIQTAAQKHTTASHTSIILCLESVFGSILAIIFLDDIFTSNMVLGSALIFIGIIITQTKPRFLYKFIVFSKYRSN